MHGKVFLLTGAAGTGKTTVAKLLTKHLIPIKRVDFGQVLLDYKRRRQHTKLSYRVMRTKSAGVISHKDVTAMDDWFSGSLKAWRTRTNVIIDSHAVTKEEFGFRVTSYSLRAS